MSNYQVLVVDDEAPIRAMLRYALETSGFVVMEAANTTEASHCIKKNKPDIILLDWMLPSQSGLRFTKALRKNKLTEKLPVILLTAKADEDYKVEGLDAGADDYVVKPFSPPELIARIKAVLRRSKEKTNEDVVIVESLRLEPKCQRFWLDNELVKLSRIQFKLLHFFMIHPDRVYSRQELLDYVWGNDEYLDERTVDVQVKRLRTKLAGRKTSCAIQTVYGSGYCFLEKVEDAT